MYTQIASSGPASSIGCIADSYRYCAGLIVGFINGFIVAKLHVPPFIATLGTMVGIYGVNSIYFDMEPNQSQPIGGLRPDFTVWGGYIDFGVGILSLHRHYRRLRCTYLLGHFQQDPSRQKYVCDRRQRASGTCIGDQCSP